MRKNAIVITSLLLTGSLLLSACANNSNNESSSANNAAAGSNSTNVEATTAPEIVPAGALSEPFTATDLSKLPAVAQKRTDTIIVGLTDPSGAFTPYFQQSGYDGNVSSLLYASLVTVDDKGVPTPELAESWDVSDDQLTYTFHLRKDLKFSDGSPLTADDVAFTWTIQYDKSYDGSSQLPSLNVKGGKAYKEGTSPTVEGIKVIDPQTISATLEQPNATALVQLGSNVLSKAYYGKDYKIGNLEYIKKLHEKPLGDGPYKLEKFIPGQEVRFVANENYFKGKPKTEHFIYKTTEGDVWQFVETGEVDYASFSATDENIEKLKALGFVNIIPYTPSTYGYLQVNLKHEQLKDKLVRQAIVYGLDRQSIYVDAAQGAGSIANIPASPISWSYTEEGINPYKYDPEKAKQLLDEAGWTVGAGGIREKDGKPLSIHYLGSKSKNTDIFIAVAKENFEALGIEFQPEVFADFNSLVSKVEGGDYDLVSFSTSMLTDPSDGFMQFFDGEITDYDNPKFLELYNKALATTDIEARKAVYKELYQLFNDELPIIFTSYKKTVYAYNGRIENLSVSPFIGLAGSLPTWSLK
ncbi:MULTISPECIES: ABC transporter substrate-binding protein [Paenibacillus]|jgi:peptide/nickel transport system substrate-binding protein|uniref:ABC transporter substrate-binding protein n=1 Tax=Paenibacillus odorifer TaxID=189426 RepID=A0A1R0Z0K0_9BACL|nr:MULTISPECIES: ABC transporter substrate-binding protein [Paenibacillus]AIQ75385.1 ABC transporter substrate-binding protein [Paenibacillus odorifer]AWV34698.1 ABC transporter substrate-binding protein [Paenibacillus odorifer]ETT49918.1 periplasmic oligopeptide-binding protein Flags: Precursor [Paenibacillus sp. FSL H8-237]OMC66651.1 ABC transporter substrate-binding protein [Paenibacillus odorifer]OMD10178.1 ABC transporter substrate-binding protein [Paenibacillus odorifer]